MRIPRTLRAFVLALVVGLTTVGVASPAQAHTNVCIGAGTLRTSAPLFFVGFGAPKVTTYDMVFPIPAQCTGVPVPELFSGTITGNCGLATGTGVTATGHVYTFTWNGGTLTFQGQVQGQLGITEDTGNDCRTGATRFRVVGGLLLSH